MDEVLTRANPSLAEPLVAGDEGPRPAPRHRGKRPARPPIGRANESIHAVAPRRFLARLRYQLLIGLIFAVALPSAASSPLHLRLLWTSPSGINTVIGAAIAFFMATLLFRRFVRFPGAKIVGQVLPAVASGYGVVVAVFLGMRLDYSRLGLFFSFAAATLFFFLVSYYLRNHVKQRFYLVPTDTVRTITSEPTVDWVVLGEPRLPADPSPVLIADLRADLGDEWERLIAETAVAGHPVYHLKQVQESLTGRVDIEHLSENSFGSLLPDHSYKKVKRAIDFLTALIALPILLLPGLFVALAIRLESRGPIFFRQTRRGYRGEIFRVVKFRTMREVDADPDDREATITREGDQRITRLGRFLRRTRIDELPQIWNILKGEMSWIGPRPEALSLSEWYMEELPFYTYRHIVRPGITGWAQVNQGHVADLGSVHEKLQFDFYYIKNFSAWLDLLIVSRTIATVWSGYGAK